MDSTMTADQATPPQPAPVANDQPLAPKVFAEGMTYLRGTASTQDFGMAAARLLDASDLGHRPAHFYCALLYFCGIGVTRNVQTASEYAERYIDSEPNGPFVATAQELADGSLGTENAKRFLLQGPPAAKKAGAAPQQQQRGLPKAAIVGIAAAVVVIGAAAVVLVMRTSASSQLDSPAAIRLDTLLPADDVDKARKEALTIAASLQTGAQSLMQERKAAEEAQARAEQERVAREAEQARLAADAQARQQAEAQSRAQDAQRQQAEQADRQRAAQAQRGRPEPMARPQERQEAPRQVQQQQMVATVRDLVRQGDFDRADRLVSAVLASDPSNRSALALQQHIQRVRQRGAR